MYCSNQVFYYALKAVMYPMAPLYDPEIQSLKPLCVRALKRIFLMCDRDKDGLLNDKELNDFQVKCFNAPLQPEELAGVKDVVQSRLENGLVDDHLTFSGFVFLHALFIERGRLETTWAVLSKFGYGKDLELAVVSKKSDSVPAQYGLSRQANAYFGGVFDSFDSDGDGVLSSKYVILYPVPSCSGPRCLLTAVSLTAVSLNRSIAGNTTSCSEASPTAASCPSWRRV